MCHKSSSKVEKFTLNLLQLTICDEILIDPH